MATGETETSGEIYTINIDKSDWGTTTWGSGGTLILGGGTDADEEEVSRELDPLLFRDKQGKFRTKSLFRESKDPGYKSYFTLRDYDYEDHISMKRKYLEINDPTEYRVAQKLLGSWKHWQRLQEAPWFRKHLAQWREELAISLESRELDRMIEFSKKDDPTGYQATKTLLERWDKHLKPRIETRGRPSKEEIEGNLHDALEDRNMLQEEAERLGIT